MGIDVFSAALLKRIGLTGHVLTIGRQALFGENADYATLLGIGDAEFAAIRTQSEGLCEGLFQFLGAASVDSLDYSGYEGATMLHDLNIPVPRDWHEHFDVVVDGGSLEHVFNYPVALRSCMEMVKRDGDLVIITPSDNQCGHGFYQISPELLFRAFGEENGFSVTEVFLRIGTGPSPQIVPLTDPAETGKRQEIRTTDSTLLYAVARRERVVPLFQAWPQQSDYVSTWRAGRD